MSDSVIGVIDKVDDIIHNTVYNYKEAIIKQLSIFKSICAHSKFIEFEDNSNIFHCNSKSKSNLSSDANQIKCKAKLQFKLYNNYYILVTNENNYHNHLPPEVS